MNETNTPCIKCGARNKFLYTNMLCTDCHDVEHKTIDCSKCNSKCKKESPCGFFTDKKKSISEIEEEILHRRWRLVQDDEREAEEDERRHQEDMEAMWRDQQHEPPEAHIDEQIDLRDRVRALRDRVRIRR